MKPLKVADEFRTNELSTKPGGSVVTIRYSNRSDMMYDKIKLPKKYVSSIIDRNNPNIIEILVDGESVWKVSDSL